MLTKRSYDRRLLVRAGRILQGRRLRAQAVGFLAPALLAPALIAPPAHADPARCHRDLLSAMAAVTQGRVGQVGRCLKSLQYEDCAVTDFHTQVHENELANRVAGASSSCAAAVAQGAAVADFGPTTCAPAWDGCDVEVPAISTLDDVAACLTCQLRGLDLAMRHELGLPRPVPADTDERRCTRRLARLLTSTVRKAVFDAAACADGGEKPFDCPLDVSEESRFGRALATFDRAVASCGLDEGRAPGVLATLCQGEAADAASLAQCLRGVATCMACHVANAGLGQGDDCSARSGLPRCDGAF